MWNVLMENEYRYVLDETIHRCECGSIEVLCVDDKGNEKGLLFPYGSYDVERLREEGCRFSDGELSIDCHRRIHGDDFPDELRTEICDYEKCPLPLKEKDKERGK